MTTIDREEAAQLVETLITCDEERIDTGECCCCARLAAAADALRGTHTLCDDDEADCT